MIFHYEFEMYLLGKTVQAYIPDLRATFASDDDGYGLVRIETSYRERALGPTLWRSLRVDISGGGDIDTLTHYAACKELELPNHVRAIKEIWDGMGCEPDDDARPRLTTAHQYFGGI